MKSNPYDAPPSSIVESPATAARVPDIRPPRFARFTTHLIAVGVWQFTCLAMMSVYGNLIGHIVVAVYTWEYGDLQSSYGRFERLSTYMGLLVITLPASVLTILIVDKLSASKCTTRRKVLLVGCWQSVTMISLAASHEFGFPYMIH